jgi:hypothetical protein
MDTTHYLPPEGKLLHIMEKIEKGTGKASLLGDELVAELINDVEMAQRQSRVLDRKIRYGEEMKGQDETQGKRND